MMTDDLKAPERLCYVNCGLPDDQCACYRHVMGCDPADRIATLEAEIKMLTRAGIIEVAIRNPSVADYMHHWESRAEKAEAALADMTRQRDKWEAAHDDLVAEIARLTSEVTQLRADDQVIVNEWIRDLAEQEKADG